jgi:hypothetical protein
MTTSAYLSLLDDWDLLGPALRSVIDRVDEVIVVDGAYRWMRPYFAKSGRDPLRSLPQVYDVLAGFGGKIKIINGIWENEPEKRMAGYTACAGRFRYRIDADEIFFFDDAAHDRFYASGKAVGQMQMPLYIAPGLIAGAPGKNLPRQSFLFDADQISARDHLSYLWLVLPEWERKTFGPPRTEMIFRESLAFNAHLTEWRPPSSSLARARFYVMNYMRAHGGAGLAVAPVEDFSAIFDKIPPAAFDEILRGKSLTVLPSESLVNTQKTPLTPAQEASFAHLHAAYLESLKALNHNLLGGWRAIQSGDEYHLDATLADSLPLSQALPEHGNIAAVQFSAPILTVKLQLACYFADPSRNQKTPLPANIQGNIAVFTMPSLPIADLLRRVLTLSFWSRDGTTLLNFRFLQVQRQSHANPITES